MTLGAAWIRRSLDGEELWIASDSRLSDSERIWDSCPKLLTLPRRDAVVGFSGDTAEAYPLMLQLANAIASYRVAADGTLEFFHMVGHLERVINSMMRTIDPDPAISGTIVNYLPFATTSDTLILGGYSRARGGMVLRSLRYQDSANGWRFQRVRPLSSLGTGRTISIFGDQRSRSRFRYLLKSLLQERGILSSTQSFDFEPLEVLAAMLRMPQSSAQRLPLDHRPATIGGAPQIMRILAGAQATPFAVAWKSRDQICIYLQGRQTFDYERLDVPMIMFEDTQVQIHAPGHSGSRPAER